jgi:hypothetical protein
VRRGWWTFRLCHGKDLAQFHQDPQSGEAESTVSCGQNRSPGGVNETPAPDVELARVSAPAEVLRLPVVRTDSFVGGEICVLGDDTTDAPRRHRTATVRYRCCVSVGSVAEDKLPHLLSVDPAAVTAIVRLEEPSTCKYEIDVCSASACSSRQLSRAVSHGLSPATVPPPVHEPAPPHGGANAVLHQFKARCMTLHEGWWSYELCVGQLARQFHAQVSQGSDGRLHQSIEAAHQLGVYSPRTQWIRPGGVLSYPPPPPGHPEFLAYQQAVAQNEVGVVLNEADPVRSYVSQLYVNGSDCQPERDWLHAPVGDNWLYDWVVKTVGPALPRAIHQWFSGRRTATERRHDVVGELQGLHVPQKRSVEARFMCPLAWEASPDLGEPALLQVLDTGAHTWLHGRAPPSVVSRFGLAMRVRSVQEVSVCHYRVIVDAPALCDHPSFAPHVNSRPVRVERQQRRARCVPEGSDGHGDGFSGWFAQSES